MGKYLAKLLIVGILVFTGRAYAESIGFSLIDSQAPITNITINVVDDLNGAPLSGVVVTIDDTQGLFAPRQGITDAQGRIQFPVISRKAQTVMAAKNGYALLTVVGFQSAQMTASLKQLTTYNEVIASGTITGFQNLGGSTVHAGIILRSLSAVDLLSFDTSSFVSPLNDEIDVFGNKYQIPSNTVLPDQSLMFGTIHLNKPLSRLPVKVGKPLLLTGIRGEAAVSDLQSSGGGSLGILNKLKFTGLGFGSATIPTANFSMDINANNPLTPKHQVTVKIPPFVADVMACALTDLSHERVQLIPTDVKLGIDSKTPNQITQVVLNGPGTNSSQSADVISVAMSDKGRRLSGIITQDAVWIVNPGDFMNTNLLTDKQPLPPSVTAPAPTSGMGAVILADAQKQPIAYIYTLPAAGNAPINLEKSVQGIAVQSYSIVQMDFGSGFNQRAFDGNFILTQLMRFTRSSATVGAD